MNNKSKKNKHKKKQNDNSSEEHQEKKVAFKESNNNDDDNSKKEKDKKPDTTRKRKHTKVSHKSKDNNLDNQIIEDQNLNGKKVKFSKIDVIDVESWKKLNLKMTAEENLEELINVTEGKKGRIKNVNCNNCLIL